MNANSALTSEPLDQALKSAAASLPGNPAAALERATALSREHSDPRVFRLVAAAARSLGRGQEAVEAELSAIRLGLHTQLRQAAAAQQAGNSAASRALAEQFIRAHPRDLLARTIAAEACMSMRQYVDGESLVREVVERAPAFPRGSIVLAKCLAAQLRMTEAIQVMDDLVKWVPDGWPALQYLADLRAQRGDYQKASGLYEKRLEAAPDDPDVLLKYAQNLRSSGRKAASVAVLRRVLQLVPHHGAAWWTLAYYSPDELDHEDVRRIQDALQDDAVPQRDSGLLRTALSIIHDRRDEHETAFRLLAAVKQDRAREQNYDPDVLSAKVDGLIAEFTPALYASRATRGAPDASPIFIVGMPRSGSTLTERILGRHSKIEAAGELQILPHLLEALEEHRRAAGFGSGTLAPLPSDLQALARWYIQRSADFRRTDKPHFVDKYNFNWLNVGLIRLIMPNARIVDVRRNALDCCWSAYRTLGDAYTNDKRHLARCYRDYVRFMAAIDVAAPGGMLTVRYEDLVDDVAARTRQILDFLRLQYEPACLDFHLSGESVATPSSEQVRRPINREGIGSATPYRQWLGPMIEELGDLAD
jgi:tetratricopeptide (TPR) repeat protein